MGGGTKGVTGLAFHTGKSPQAVYGWLNAGRIYDVLDALKVRDVAHAVGCEITIEELAGQHNVADGPPDGTRADEVADRADSAVAKSEDAKPEGDATSAVLGQRRGRGRPRSAAKKVATGRSGRQALGRRSLCAGIVRVRRMIDRPDLSEQCLHSDDVTILLRLPQATGTGR